MKKNLISAILASIMVAGISVAANAQELCPPPTNNCPNSTANTQVDVSLPKTTIVSASSAQLSAAITPCEYLTGKLPSNLVPSFTIQTNSPQGASVSFTAETPTGCVKGLIYSGASASSRKIALVNTAVPNITIGDALSANPIPRNNKNVIAYPLTLSSNQSLTNISFSNGALSMNVPTDTTQISLTINQNPVSGTYAFPGDLAGTYGARVICTVASL